jgi:hypothetical protein
LVIEAPYHVAVRGILSAAQWLSVVEFDPLKALKYRVFLIDNPDVPDAHSHGQLICAIRVPAVFLFFYSAGIRV